MFITIDAKKFHDIPITGLDGKTIPLQKLWQNNPVILKILSRLGCALCKHEAKQLSELKLLFEALGVRMVAIVFEEVDLRSFLESGYWACDVYIDRERRVYQTAGLTRLSKFQLMKEMISRRFIKALSFCTQKGFHTNLKGDIYQLGATLVISPNDEIIYWFIPKKLALFPCLKELLWVVGGDPDDVEEALPKDMTFSRSSLLKFEEDVNSVKGYTPSYYTI